MTKIDKNRGVLERWADIRVALIKAGIYSLFHWGSRVYVENIWVEDRGELDLYGDPMLAEIVTYVAVIRGNILLSNLEILKEFYGEPRFDPSAYQGNYHG